MDKGDMRLESIDDETEGRRVIIINRPSVTPQTRCERCAEPSGMITPDEAAALCNLSTRTVYRWLETGTIHFSDTVGGAPLICLQSLAAVGMNDK